MRRIGKRLCHVELLTPMVLDREATTVRRIYSSRPEAYPVGGSKPKRHTEWGRQVLLEGRGFEGEGEATIRKYFADQELLLGLGVRSIVNLPILVAEYCADTLNVSWTAAMLDRNHVRLTQLLALLATHDWSFQDHDTAEAVRTA
jgi:hypothetical protein